MNMRTYLFVNRRDGDQLECDYQRVVISTKMLHKHAYILLCKSARDSLEMRYNAKKNTGKCLNESSTPQTHDSRWRQGDPMDTKSKSALCVTQSLATECF